MQYLCPRCGAPVNITDITVIGERDITCTFCGCKTATGELVAVDDEVHDPRVFDVFLTWFSEKMGPHFAQNMSEFIPTSCFVEEKTETLHNVMVFGNRMARVYVSAIFRAILDPNVVDGCPDVVPNTRLVHLMASNIDEPVVRTLTQLQLIVKSTDPRNIRYVTNILKYSTRCLQDAIEKARKDGDGDGSPKDAN